jgi:hypothetical protein
VYLGEENKPDGSDKPTTSNGNGESSAAPTFLMYNKISTTITGKESPTSLTNGTNGSGEGGQKPNKNDKKKNDKNRESAIWYKNLFHQYHDSG